MFDIDMLFRESEESVIPVNDPDLSEPTNEKKDEGIFEGIEDEAEGPDEAAEESTIATAFLTTEEDRIFLEVAEESSEIDDFLFSLEKEESEEDSNEED